MYIKWIRCEVENSDKERFSEAQKRWSALHGLPGFGGQAGGWNVENPLEACIVSFWRDEESYRLFMQEQHDPIFAMTGQSGTYTRIAVSMYDGTWLQSKEEHKRFEALIRASERETKLCVQAIQSDEFRDLDRGPFIAYGQSKTDPANGLLLWTSDDRLAFHQPTWTVRLDNAWLVV